MLFRWVLVRVIVALLKEETLFLLKEQQSPEQAPTAKVQYVVIKTTCLAKWGGRLWVLVRSTDTQLEVVRRGGDKPLESSSDEAFGHKAVNLSQAECPYRYTCSECLSCHKGCFTPVFSTSSAVGCGIVIQ